MKKNNKKTQEVKEAKVFTYTYEALVDSNRYSEHEWAIRTALDKDKRYTLEQADKAYYDFLNKEVK